MQVNEFRVSSPHLPGSNRGLYLYSIDSVWFGFTTFFMTSDVNGLEGRHLPSDPSVRTSKVIVGVGDLEMSVVL